MSRWPWLLTLLLLTLGGCQGPLHRHPQLQQRIDNMEEELAALERAYPEAGTKAGRP